MKPTRRGPGAKTPQATSNANASDQLRVEPGSVDENADDEPGLSLEELSQTYAQVLGQGIVPYQQADAAPPAASVLEPTGEFDPLAEELVEDDQCPITPLSILEAILFVGRADNQAISAEEVAGMMRGVRTAEIEQLVEELNEIYSRDGHALRVVASGAGFAMQLAPEHSAISERFYGRVREAKLNQPAIDCLALIAYQPGITRERLEEQRGQPSGGILNQLVRRQLVEMRREDAKGKKGPPTKHYYPTERLLSLTGLESLDELPLAEDFER